MAKRSLLSRCPSYLYFLDTPLRSGSWHVGK